MPRGPGAARIRPMPSGAGVQVARGGDGDPPRLVVLGPPSLRDADGHRTPWTAERPHVLLALLACRRDWVGRDELADLLYPGRDLPAARSNLRKVLHLARQVAGVADLEQRGDLLRWAPDSDLLRFEAACTAHRTAQAIALYGGPLLQGMDAGFPVDAAEWLHAERQRLHARWHEACLRRLAELHDAPDAACELAQALLRADPLDEHAVQALARAQQALGRPADAVAALQDYERQLSGQAGLRPSAAVRALGDVLQGRTGHPPHLGDADAAGSGLVGRRHELLQVAQRLAEPGCRLLTVLGEPGVGKSTLARAALARYPGPAAWVPLEDLQHPDEVPERIAALVKVALEAGLPPWAALAEALGDSPPRLLVLDNAEHLALGPPLGDLLAARPVLRVLATSRAPLAAVGEWRLPLAGLPLPDIDETDAEVLRANDAVRLFEQRARALAPGFDLAAEAADVVRLVHEVEGLPLAIELLAAWRRLMPVRDILAELAESLELLEPEKPSERSVRASFARAWQQLGPLEQRVLAQMAVLPGPLSRTQVRTVLQAPLPVLAALGDRSLLRAEEGGQFSLHPLIRRCAAPLADDVPALRQRHARQLAQQLAADARLDIPQAHLRAAWQWGVEALDPTVLKALAWPLRHHFHHLGSRSEGAAMLDQARQALQAAVVTEGAAGSAPAAGRGRENLEALWRVLFVQSAAAYDSGDMLATDQAAVAAADCAGRLRDGRLHGQALARRAAVCYQRGRFEEGLKFMDQALARYREAAFEPGAWAMGIRAVLLKCLGRYDEALAVQEGILAELRRSGGLRGQLHIVINMGSLLRAMGRTHEALALLHEGLHLARQPGDPSDEPWLLATVAAVHETLHDTEAAMRWADQALRATLEHGEPVLEAEVAMMRARLGAASKRPLDESWIGIAQALRIGQRLKAEPTVIQAIASAGIVLARTGQRPLGLALVRWAQRQPKFTRADSEDAERQLAPLRIDASEEIAALRLLPPDASLQHVLDRLPAAVLGADDGGGGRVARIRR
jgi:DNA-binding SARP family transcriptional activator/tetratricopeptide (TPR) repeat protein